MPAPRWTRRRGSAIAPLFVEESLRGDARRDDPAQTWVAGSAARDGRPEETSSFQFRQAVLETPALPGHRRHQLGDDVTAVRHLNVLTPPDHADVFTQPVLELSQTNLPHAPTARMCPVTKLEAGEAR